jgi:signal transduction histidine kinase
MRRLAHWVAALACCLVPVVASAAGACDAARTIDSAVRTARDGTATLDAAQVALPDRLPRAWQRESVRVAYEADLLPCDGPPRALYVFRLGAPYRISVDGVPLSPLQPAAPRDEAFNGRVPALFDLPPGGRRLRIELQTLAYVPSGLIRVEEGTRISLLEAAAEGHGLTTDFNNLSSAVIAMAGLLALCAWALRRQDHNLVWFGAACLLWAVRGVVYQTFALPLPPIWMEQLNPLLTLCTVGCITVSTLHAVGTWTRRRAMLLGVVYGTILLVLLASLLLERGGAAARALAYVGGFAVTVSLPANIWRHRDHLGTVRSALLAGGFVTLIAGAAYDLSMVVGLMTPDHPTFVTPGFTVLLLCHFLAVLLHLVRALNQAERSNVVLESVIAAKTQELERSYELLRDREREAARLAEREHLLREMHDGIGAQLVTTLRGVERTALTPQQVQAALQEGLDELRLLMDSGDIGRTLDGALAAWRHRWEPRLSALGLELRWQVAPDLHLAEIAPSAVLQVMRILQEAVTNTVKHARATHLVVRARLQGHPATLLLEVEDDGIGLAPTQAPGPGRGLRNMVARARQLGGELETGQPVTGAGALLRLRLPLGVAAAAVTGK